MLPLPSMKAITTAMKNARFTPGFRRRVRRALLAAALAGFMLPGAARADEVLVFAAASQRDALDAVIGAYERTGEDTVRASYQSSSTLARQIAQGAPAGLFISANPDWMDWLETRDLIDAATRTAMFGNGLVLVTARSAETRSVEIGKGFDLAGRLDGGRLALGDPAHVPAGIYAKQALQSLGAWQGVEGRLARAENVRAALALVARGEAPLGIVYASDAVADATVKVVGCFPDDSHAPIVYPVAVTASAGNPDAAKAFLSFLRTPEAAGLYEKFGFRVLKHQGEAAGKRRRGETCRN